MENERYLLEPVNNNKFVNILQVFFGIICILVAIVWIVLNFTSYKPTLSIWITIAFLAIFGYVQIISGLGKATKFIEYSNENVTVKSSSFLPLQKIAGSEIEQIEIYPLSIHFLLHSGKKRTLRFGTSYTEIIETVKKATEKFGVMKNLPVNYKHENL